MANLCVRIGGALLWALGLCMLRPALAVTQPPTLDEPPIDPQTGRVRLFSVGDPAPRLKPEVWVRGEPIERLEKGMVYVVWFFATWSEKSQAAMQAVADLHSTFKDKGVVVIGISLWETTFPPADGAKCVDRLRAFVKGREKLFPYAIAFDGEEGEMAQTWMRGGDRRGIPAMFIIDRDGVVAWMGHPLAADEPPAKVIEGLLAGTYDVKSAAERARKDAADLERARRLDRQYQRAISQGDGRRARETLDELLKIRHSEFQSRVPEVFRLLAVDNGESTAAYEWLNSPTVNLRGANPDVLNSLAWTIVTDERLTDRNLDLALRMADMAAEASKRREAYILDTLARVHFERGEHERAISVQAEALSVAPRDEKARYQAVLDKYRAKMK